ncbi:MAG: pyridoxamine 5'-phosphate oxidase family protein [Candidatus Aceula lacicola]|nr:pyridoxamine 5'-phosphate oxidase family protein [Candidatus Aceula lacicola]
MKLPKEIVQFFEKSHAVIVSTLNEKGAIHCSVKGLVGVGKKDKLFLTDLYLYRTFCNLKKNPTISVTALDEHAFKGYVLQGKAKIIPKSEIKKEILDQWEARVVQRITKRVQRSVSIGAKSKKHFEAHLPIDPKYLIEVKIDNIIDLSPPTRKTKIKSCSKQAKS